MIVKKSFSNQFKKKFWKLFCVLQENFLHQWKRIRSFYECGHEGKICISCSLQVYIVDWTSTVVAETFVDMEYQTCQIYIFDFITFFSLNFWVYLMLTLCIKKKKGLKSLCTKYLLKLKIYLTYNSNILHDLSVTSAVSLPCPPSSELTSRVGWGRSNSVITHKSSTPSPVTASNRSEVIYWQHLFVKKLLKKGLIMLCCWIIKTSLWLTFVKIWEYT